MISLAKILSSNLEMLKSQEADLLKSLKFVQKAKQLFQAHWGNETGKRAGKKRGRPVGKMVKPRVAAALETQIKKTKTKVKRARKKGEKRVTHLTKILTVLKKRGKPMTSGELIAVLFKKQHASKNIKHFRLLIYPVLTKAYASKTLIQKGGKIHLPG